MMDDDIDGRGGQCGCSMVGVTYRLEIMFLSYYGIFEITPQISQWSSLITSLLFSITVRKAKTVLLRKI